MKKLFIPALIVLIVSIFSVLYLRNSSGISTKKETSSATSTHTTIPMPFEAKFAIYTNGTFRIFSDPRYHNQSKDIYINSDKPNYVVVNKVNSTWNDFFNSLPMKLDDSCLTTGTGQIFCTNENYKLQFFINGEAKENALREIILPTDELLVTYGNEDSESINTQLKSLGSL